MPWTSGGSSDRQVQFSGTSNLRNMLTARRADGETGNVRISHLSGILANAARGAFTTNDHVARYFSSVTSSATMNGNTDVSNRGVTYHIGKAHTLGNGLVPTNADKRRAIEAIYTVSDVVRSEIAHMAKKSNALAGQWEVMDLCGLVEGLAKGIGHYRVHGSLTQEQMAGTAEMRYLGINSMTSPIAPSDSVVYVPSSVDSAMHGHTMAAIIAATTGAGGTVVSDMVGINATTNRPIVPGARDLDLVYGCYNALTILGANFEQHNAGAQFAYAFTVGIHKQVTVHGHTDEGGINRDILRSCNFQCPRGAIVTGLPEYVGLGSPVGGAGNVIKLVDTIALVTAACVAISDPCTTIDGKTYPTVITCDNPNGTRDEVAESNMRQIAVDYSRFARNYATMLARTFSVAGGEEKVTHHMTGSVTQSVTDVRRHLMHDTLSPFFWIEPTGLVECDKSGMVAQVEGFGTLCTQKTKGTRPMLCGAEPVGGNGYVSAWDIDFRCARRHGVLLHLQLHALDGLAHIKPRRLDVQQVIMTGPGAAGRRDEALADKVRNSRGMDEYLWGRGHSSIPCPAEFIESKGGIGIVISHQSPSIDMLSVRANHVPTVEELGGDVTFTTTSLAGIGVVPRTAVDKGVNRERRLAARKLMAARNMPLYRSNIDLIMPIEIDNPDTPDPDEEEALKRAVGGMANPATVEELEATMRSISTMVGQATRSGGSRTTEGPDVEDALEEEQDVGIGVDEETLTESAGNLSSRRDTKDGKRVHTSQHHGSTVAPRGGQKTATATGQVATGRASAEESKAPEPS